MDESSVKTNSIKLIRSGLCCEYNNIKDGERVSLKFQSIAWMPRIYSDVYGWWKMFVNTSVYRLPKRLCIELRYDVVDCTCVYTEKKRKSALPVDKSNLPMPDDVAVGALEHRQSKYMYIYTVHTASTIKLNCALEVELNNIDRESICWADCSCILTLYPSIVEAKPNAVAATVCHLRSLNTQ